MRVSEALALEARHFINGGRTIRVEQQVAKDCPRIVKDLKTSAAKREIDLHTDVAEFLQRYRAAEVCCSTRRKAHHVFMAISRTVGLRLGLSKWDWTNQVWAGTPLSGSAKRGCAGLAVWRTLTTSGWGTNRKPCLSCTRISTRSLNYASRRPSE